MSHENVELGYRAADAFNRHDLDAFLGSATPTSCSSRATWGAGPHRGRNGVRDWWENLLGVFPDFSSEIEEARDLGDVTVEAGAIEAVGLREYGHPVWCLTSATGGAPPALGSRAPRN